MSDPMLLSDLVEVVRDFMQEHDELREEMNPDEMQRPCSCATCVHARDVIARAQKVGV